jgi:hypothetical protein
MTRRGTGLATTTVARSYPTPPVGDGEIEVYGSDPWARTRPRIVAAQEYLIRFCATFHRYPDRLVEAFPPRSNWAMEYDRDAWGRLLRYRATGSDYELRSAGADGVFDTNDDLVGTATSLLLPAGPTFAIEQPNPCAGAKG